MKFQGISDLRDKFLLGLNEILRMAQDDHMIDLSNVIATLPHWMLPSDREGVYTMCEKIRDVLSGEDNPMIRFTGIVLPEKDVIVLPELGILTNLYSVTKNEDEADKLNERLTHLVICNNTIQHWEIYDMRPDNNNKRKLKLVN